MVAHCMDSVDEPGDKQHHISHILIMFNFVYRFKDVRLSILVKQFISIIVCFVSWLLLLWHPKDNAIICLLLLSTFGSFFYTIYLHKQSLEVEQTIMEKENADVAAGV